MAIKIGKNGELYCNTVKYNWKQCRNMIADGCCGNMSGAWTFANGVSYVNEPCGYKSYRCFKIATGTPAGDLFQQKLPKLISGHKYYFSVFQKMLFDIASSALIHIVFRFITPNFSYNFKIMPHISRGEWYKWSDIFTSEGDSTETTLLVYGQSGNPSVTKFTRDIYLDKFILVDLTDTFGAGNEPSEEWCNKNIREHEVIINYGSMAPAVKKDNLTKIYYEHRVTRGCFDYLTLDSFWEPRDYMYMLTGQTNNVEGYIFSSQNSTLENNEMFYACIDYHRPYSYTQEPDSIDFYFPEAEPVLGHAPIVKNQEFNSGGGMSEWKRASVFNDRKSFSSGSYKLRIDYNNNYTNNEMRLTAINLIRVRDNVEQYNIYNGTNITINDVNKEWCDRWIDGRSSPIIHIKDPNNTKIKFNENYDIICNDIEIRPELKEVKFDLDTGTIYCSKLIKEQEY